MAAALTVLARRPPDPPSSPPLDLHAIRALGAQLANGPHPANLRGADLRGAHLIYADLSGADLRGAEGMSEADVRKQAVVDPTTRFGRLPE